jgi:signal transduction histidine kinase
MASHELKTPLVPINGYCEMLLESGLIGDLNDEQKEFVNKIQLNSHTLKTLIDKILQAQRLDMNKQSWNFETKSIGNFMGYIHEFHLPMTGEKNIHFTNKTTDDVSISTDFNQLQEVFTNLIQNAVDFVSENGEIEINVKDNGDSVLFYVKDNGAGIPKEKQSHIFKKFYQADTSHTRSHGGTGLGLSICEGIVKGLGGKIWVESEIGMGSTFYFSIPKNHLN